MTASSILSAALLLSLLPSCARRPVVVVADQPVHSAQTGRRECARWGKVRNSDLAKFTEAHSYAAARLMARGDRLCEHPAGRAADIRRATDQMEWAARHATVSMPPIRDLRVEAP